VIDTLQPRLMGFNLLYGLSCLLRVEFEGSF